MTEQVIDIRDRIEKMRNQITVPGTKMQANEKKPVIDKSKSVDNKNSVAEKNKDSTVSKPYKNENFNSANNPSNFVEKKKSPQIDEFQSRTNVLEKSNSKF